MSLNKFVIGSVQRLDALEVFLSDFRIRYLYCIFIIKYLSLMFTSSSIFLHFYNQIFKFNVYLKFLVNFLFQSWIADRSIIITHAMYVYMVRLNKHLLRSSLTWPKVYLSDFIFIKLSCCHTHEEKGFCQLIPTHSISIGWLSKIFNK